MIGTLLLRLGLASIFGSAAILKARSLPAFVDDLRSIFRALSLPLAISVIGVEGLLAVAFIVLERGLFPVLLACSSFVLFATLFIALRLLLIGESDCGCWGANSKAGRKSHIGWTGSPRHSFVDVLRIAGYGLRNSVIILLILVLSWNGENMVRHLEMPNTLVLALAPMGIIAVALSLSIIRGLWQLKLPQHPLSE